MSKRFLGKAGLLIALAASSAFAQYHQTNLVSTFSNATPHKDPNLVNGWGIAAFPGSPYWISDNGTGLSTLYDQAGNIIPLVVTIPPAPSQPLGPRGTPTGIIANPSTGFQVTAKGVSGSAAFVFASEDGTISGWSPAVDATHAVIAVDNSATFALYTGLTFLPNGTHPLIYAADAVNNHIDVYNSLFHKVKSFSDPNAPAGLGVYGVQNLNGQIYVTFANPVPFSGGAIDVFDNQGNFIKQLSSNGPSGPLQGAWGMAMAPSNFGKFSNALLVGNVDNGHINAFDPDSGAFLGSLMDSATGNAIRVPGLWGLMFGSGNAVSGAKNDLFFSAGPDAYRRGIFGKIFPAK
jgi:uncharacterized protein (TIGR03118 family)